MPDYLSSRILMTKVARCESSAKLVSPSSGGQSACTLLHKPGSSTLEFDVVSVESKCNFKKLINEQAIQLT